MDAKVAYYPTGEELRLADLEADAGQIDKLKQRIAMLEQRATRAESHLAWLERQMNRLALRIGPLDGEMEQLNEQTSI